MWKDKQSTDMTFVVTDNGMNNVNVNSLIEANAGRAGVHVVKMWAMMSE